jgi:hypothetical protein
VRHPKEAHGKGGWAHMPVRHCGRRPTAGTGSIVVVRYPYAAHNKGRVGHLDWHVGPSVPCVKPLRRTAKAAGPHAVRHLATLTGMWVVYVVRLTPEAHGKGTAGHQGWQVGPSLPCASPLRRTAKIMGPVRSALCRAP